jgi:hypothetical protein
MFYQIQEGYLTLGEGDWQDRTVNMLAANHLPVKGTNLVVTRETLPPGITFADYISNQQGELSKALASFKLLADSPDIINDTPARLLEFSWDNQGTAMHQMILIIHDNGNVLNLTATVPGTIDEATRTMLLTIIKSFNPGPAPVTQQGAAK